MDRKLYLPEGWTNDPARLRSVGLAPDFAIKPEQARWMLKRALEAGLPVAWVTGDSVYGHSTNLRRWLEERGRSYVLAVAGNEHVWVGFRQVRVGKLWMVLPEADGETQACGPGAKGCQGPRIYDWQCRVLAEPGGGRGWQGYPHKYIVIDPGGTKAWPGRYTEGLQLLSVSGV